MRRCGVRKWRLGLERLREIPNNKMFPSKQEEQVKNKNNKNNKKNKKKKAKWK